MVCGGKDTFFCVNLWNVIFFVYLSLREQDFLYLLFLCLRQQDFQNFRIFKILVLFLFLSGINLRIVLIYGMCFFLFLSLREQCSKSNICYNYRQI